MSHEAFLDAVGRRTVVSGEVWLEWDGAEGFVAQLRFTKDESALTTGLVRVKNPAGEWGEWNEATLIADWFNIPVRLVPPEVLP